MGAAHKITIGQLLGPIRPNSLSFEGRCLPRAKESLRLTTPRTIALWILAVRIGRVSGETYNDDELRSTRKDLLMRTNFATLAGATRDTI